MTEHLSALMKRALFALTYLTLATTADAQSANDGRYIFEIALYAPGGEFQLTTGSIPFKSAEQCDRHVTASIVRGRASALAKGYLTKYYGKSVILGSDNSGVWFACIKYEEHESDAHLRYFNVTMSPKRAAMMSRFPEFSPGK